MKVRRCWGFYLRLDVTRPMRILHLNQCVPAVWSLWRCALYWGALTVHTNIHTHTAPPPHTSTPHPTSLQGLWCQAGYGRVFDCEYRQADKLLVLPAAPTLQNVIPTQQTEVEKWHEGKPYNCMMLDHLLRLFFFPFKYEQFKDRRGKKQMFASFDCRWGFGKTVYVCFGFLNCCLQVQNNNDLYNLFDEVSWAPFNM